MAADVLEAADRGPIVGGGLSAPDPLGDPLHQVLCLALGHVEARQLEDAVAGVADGWSLVEQVFSLAPGRRGTSGSPSRRGRCSHARTASACSGREPVPADVREALDRGPGAGECRSRPIRKRAWRAGVSRPSERRLPPR
jgi:hypothetical protein